MVRPVRSPVVFLFLLCLFAILVAACASDPAVPPGSSTSPADTAGPTIPAPTPGTERNTPLPAAVPETKAPETMATVQEPPGSGSSGQRPIAEFFADPTSGKVPLEVRFTDRSTGSPDGWFWDFGDGTSSLMENPVHVYSSPGTFTVRLNASNRWGSNTESKFYSITVHPAAQQPTALFTANRPSPGQPYTVQFFDRSTGPPSSWSWNFGDGGTSDQQNPFHTYPGPGTFTVTLEVANSAGNGETTGWVTLGSS